MTTTPPPSGGERMTGEALRSARASLGFSGVELAQRLEVRADTLRRWEAEREPIPYAVPGELLAIVEAQIDVLEDLADRLSE